jgi:hypothetical protein
MIDTSRCLHPPAGERYCRQHLVWAVIGAFGTISTKPHKRQTLGLNLQQQHVARVGGARYNL